MKFILILFCLVSFSISNAQETLAKIEFAAAEEDYQAGNYAESLEHLETVKEMLGSTNSTVMYLEILAKEEIQHALNEILQLVRIPSVEELQEKERELKLKLQRFEVTVQHPKNVYRTKEYYSNALSQTQKILQWFNADKNSDHYNIGYLIENAIQINQLSTSYVESFENNISTEKLAGIYKIYKKYKPVIIELNEFKKSIIHLSNNNMESARPHLKIACTAGNNIACDITSLINDSVEVSHEATIEFTVFHTVGKKETLYSIAKKYNMPVAKLMNQNDVVGGIQVGQQLAIK